MRKSLWMLGLAAAAMTSCTQNEVLEVAENRAIGFDDVFVGKATRAANPTENSLDVLQQSGNGFYVYGGYETVTDVFADTHVTYNSNNTPKWEYSPIRYWVANQNYKFVAYAPAMGEGVTKSFAYGNSVSTPPPATNDATLTFTDVVIDGTADNQKDFIVAKSGVITPNDNNYNTAVKFNFFHALSMIKVTLRNGFADGVQVAISNFEITGINTKGKFVTKSDADFSTGDCGEWTDQAEPETTSTFTDTGATLTELWTIGQDGTASKAYSNEFIVIPQTIGAVQVEFNVTVTDAHGDKIVDNKSFNVAIPTNSNSAWDINNRYHYTLTIDGKSVDLTPIVFDEPSVEDWADYKDEEELVTPGS